MIIYVFTSGIKNYDYKAMLSFGKRYKDVIYNLGIPRESDY